MGRLLDGYTLSGRETVLSFLYVPELGTWNRMESFTSLTANATVKEHTRRMNGMDMDVTDVVGTEMSMDYVFDYRVNGDDKNAVLELLRDIHIGRKTGISAVVKICTVFVSDFCESGWQPAIVQQFCVCPNNFGSTTDCLTFSGTLKQNAEDSAAIVCSVDDWQTIYVSEV